MHKLYGIPWGGVPSLISGFLSGKEAAEDEETHAIVRWISVRSASETAAKWFITTDEMTPSFIVVVAVGAVANEQEASRQTSAD